MFALLRTNRNAKFPLHSFQIFVYIYEKRTAQIAFATKANIEKEIGESVVWLFDNYQRPSNQSGSRCRESERLQSTGHIAVYAI